MYWPRQQQKPSLACAAKCFYSGVDPEHAPPIVRWLSFYCCYRFLGATPVTNNKWSANNILYTPWNIWGENSYMNSKGIHPQY